MKTKDTPPVRSQINRRAFLRGAGGVAIALPFLEGLPERSAFAGLSANPVFGLFIVTANGVVQKDGSDPERFWPTATGAITSASLAAATDRSTSVLSDHANHLLFVRGVNYPYSSSGCGHAQGLVQCLTASQPSGSANKVVSTGESIDTTIAKLVNPAGVDPLTLYSGMKEGYINEKISFSAAGQVRAAEGNPYNVYKKLMGVATTSGTGAGGASGAGGSSGGNSVLDQLVKRRKSANDLVRAELNALRARTDLSMADKMRLEQHFTAIRDLENTMTGMVVPGAQCSTKGLDVAALEALNTGSVFKQNGKIEDVTKLHMELVGIAFSCNLTRVATIQSGDGTDHTNYVIDGVKSEKFHYISHRVTDDGGGGGSPIAGAVDLHAKIDRIRLQTFKYLLDKWATYATPNGPLLDNAFAMWTSHVAAGPSHGFRNLPIIIAGSGGGYLKQGQYVDAANVTNGKLMNTLITAAGGRTGGAAYTGFAGQTTGISQMVA
jgi:hypothetical protein